MFNQHPKYNALYAKIHSSTLLFPNFTGWVFTSQKTHFWTLIYYHLYDFLTQNSIKGKREIDKAFIRTVWAYQKPGRTTRRNTKRWYFLPCYSILSSLLLLSFVMRYYILFSNWPSHLFFDDNYFMRNGLGEIFFCTLKNWLLHWRTLWHEHSVIRYSLINQCANFHQKSSISVFN